MKKSEHTPGPWGQSGLNVRADGGNGKLLFIPGPDDFLHSDTVRAQCVADADLIARAPALLAEVERLRALLRPFAHFADLITDHGTTGNIIYSFISPRGEAAILKSDCEAARAALSPSTGEPA